MFLSEISNVVTTFLREHPKFSKLRVKISVINSLARAVQSKAHRLCRMPEWADRASRTSRNMILFHNGYYDFSRLRFYLNDDPEFDRSICFLGRIEQPYVYVPGVDEEEDEKRISIENLADSIYNRFFSAPLGEEVGFLLLKFTCKSYVW